MDSLVTLVGHGIQALIYAIFARSILTWFPIDRNGPIVGALNAITEPILEPVRRIVPRMGAVDISPMIAIVLLAGILWALRRGS
ncbi:MAG TPA: YggT family protein [Dehalococcoidia bacterium]|jgi:YggT family protein|nr:YggT family protein [Dehalococcoidia bacterium]